MLEEKIISEMIKKITDIKKISREQLARELGVKFKTIENICSNIYPKKSNYLNNIYLRLIKLYCKLKT